LGALTNLKKFKDNNHIFYISSRGHNGTKWLSSSLSLHPEIICWHGTRSIPPIASNRQESLLPHEFANGLAVCNQACQNSKIFGAVHGFYGLDMKQPIEAENGSYLFLIRNPIAAINSNFVCKMKQMFPEIKSQDNLETFLRDLLLDKLKIEAKYDLEDVKKIRLNLPKAHKKIVSHKGMLKEHVPKIYAEHKLSQIHKTIINSFLNSVTEITYFDYVNLLGAGFNCMIRFEQMVISKEYFRKNILSKIHSSIECSNKYLDQVFNQDAINQHSGKSYSAEQIRNRWLPFQNKIFDSVAFEGYLPVANAYSNAQYRISPLST